MKYEQTVQVELQEYICMVKRIDGVVAQKSLEQELIRCKDCKYNNGGRCSWHGGAGYKWIVDDDDFCSIAERKDVYVTLHHDDIHFKDEESEKAFYDALERKEEWKTQR